MLFSELIEMKKRDKVTVCFVTFITILLPLIYATTVEECKCICSGFSGQTVCEKLNTMRLEVDSNTGELKKWAPLFDFVQNLKITLRDDIVNIVRTEIEKYAISRKVFPIAENLVRKADDEMMNDSSTVTKPTEDDSLLAKNVSNLLVKVEMVENRTIEVEEELKSERRVRRHLEQEVKETQSSLISLEDQLMNVTAPVDAIISEVQRVVLLSIEDMNRTIHEEHLQKLYYKVDGVVYQNETKKLGERLEHVETELRDESNSSIVLQLAEDLKNIEKDVNILNSSIGDNLVPRLKTLETDTVRKDSAEKLEMKMANLLNSTEIFRIELGDVWSDIQDFKSFQLKLQNFSEEWTNSLETLKIQIEELKNKTHEDAINTLIVQEPNEIDDAGDIIFINETNDIFQVLNDTDQFENINIKENGVNVTLIDENRIRIGGGKSDYSCDIPIIDDPHLLVDVQEDSKGETNLVFGCRPIGRYIVTKTPVPVRCNMGSWKGPFPSCHLLLDENRIEFFAQELQEEHPCRSGSGEFPDFTDCTRFFKCSHGRAAVMNCLNDLHFNPRLKVCDYPNVVQCTPTHSNLTRQLQDLVPLILIEPNNVDKPSGLFGTGYAGQLIIHPRSTFTFHCLYPENVWGMPSWNVAYFDTETSNSMYDVKQGKNRISLTVIAAKEYDSGIYKCVTPFGKEHSIQVFVKAVLCSPFSIDEELVDVYYRPTPEGEHRVLGTTAEFQCEEGHKIIAVCMANGNWSRSLPKEDECSLKRKDKENAWECKPFDTSKEPNLILERIEGEKIVAFKCAGRLRLIGNTFTRCREDGYWSHMSLPRCVS